MNSKKNKFSTFIGHNKLFIILALLTIIPFLILSFFNNPGSDDFEFSHMTKLLTFEKVQVYRYNNEGGRFFANGILSLNPLVFDNYFLFRIIPFFMIVLFLFSIHFFVTTLFENSSFQKKIILSGLVIFVYFYQLPDACSSFYWLTGAMTYQLPIDLTLCYFSFLLRYYQNKKWLDFFLAVIFMFLTFGCNELVAVMLVFSHLFVLVYLFWKFKKIDFVLGIILLLSIAFALIEILAPGNIVRSHSIIDNHKFIFSISKSLLFTIRFMLEWLPIILICTLFFVRYFYKIIDNMKLKSIWIHPTLSLFLLLSLLYIPFFIGFWSINSILPDRALNMIYFFFILSSFYLMLTVLNYLKEKYNFQISYTSFTKQFLGFYLLITMFSGTPLFLAYHDLLIGKAYKYNQEMKVRFHSIIETKEKKITVPALINKPTTLYSEVIMGLTTDKNNWKNLELSRFYNKEILVQPTDSVVTE